ncbi:uncharacterized protein [Cicer arietinum]|uniref:uncharacterized protein n=1 Tax=Cicer arietinum TaxID=3827 RepID=UPI0006415EA9
MVRLSFLLLVFLVCVTSTYAVKVVDIDTICKNVKNHSFCSNLLNSKPGAKEDLVSLTQYTIDVLHDNITNTVNLINKLIVQSAGNFNLTYHYQSCLSVFGIKNGGALQLIEEVKKLFKTRNYTAVITYLNDISFDALACLVTNSPSDTSVLSKYVDDVKQVTDIVRIILSYLMQA